MNVRIGPSAEERKVTSVGLVCTCGKAVAGIPGSTCSCQNCGAVWLVSIMQLAPRGCGRIGFYTSSSDDEPTYNPDPRGPCLLCWKPMPHDDVRTHSLAAVAYRERSYFFRTHASCADADPEHVVLIESAIIDGLMEPSR